MSRTAKEAQGSGMTEGAGTQIKGGIHYDAVNVFSRDRS